MRLGKIRVRPRLRLGLSDNSKGMSVRIDGTAPRTSWPIPFVHSINPGGVEIEATHALGCSDFEKKITAQTPVGRIGRLGDITRSPRSWRRQILREILLGAVARLAPAPGWRKHDPKKGGYPLLDGLLGKPAGRLPALKYPAVMRRAEPMRMTFAGLEASIDFLSFNKTVNA